MSDPTEVTEKIESENLPVHVKLCRLRHRGIERRLNRLEYILFGLLALVAAGRDSPLREIVVEVLAKQ